MKVVLGTMNVGPQLDSASTTEMLSEFGKMGGVEVDTAYVYNDGVTERMLGASFREASDYRFKLATKVNPRVTGRLDERSVVQQLNTSLERMGVPCVDILYLHFPDPNTPLEETLGACAKLYDSGKFREFGLSNFSLASIKKAVSICDRGLCPRPSVYQGVYNALSRAVEEELLPAIDELGMRFYAYNPLAGGMLTGKYHAFSDDCSGGRFSLRPSYRDRYWKESYFKAVEVIRCACDDAGISMAKASLMWLAQHSALSAARSDGVIVGVSRVNQLRDNYRSLTIGSLPNAVVEAFDRAWDITRCDAPSYFRTSSAPKKGVL